ncbi:hypothetical protein AURDEDRAFT_123419 [Auricularia subglabra TFB-10046 SS5]|nr:hypothetical protein AURDEDRAFT_123419 [Auricularia subglabra TFB-10046 SS5]
MPPASAAVCAEDDAAALARLAEIDTVLGDSADRAEFLKCGMATTPLARWSAVCDRTDKLRAGLVTADGVVEQTRGNSLLASIHSAAENTVVRLQGELEQTEGQAMVLARDLRDYCGLWTVLRRVQEATEPQSTATVPLVLLSTPPATPSRSLTGKRAREGLPAQYEKDGTRSSRKTGRAGTRRSFAPRSVQEARAAADEQAKLRGPVTEPCKLQASAGPAVGDIDFSYQNSGAGV